MRRVILGSLLLTALFAAKGRGQTGLPMPDSVDGSWDAGITETLISLDLLRLDQWLLRHAGVDSLFVQELLSLRSQASTLLADGDLQSAEAFLEICWELIQALPSDAAPEESGMSRIPGDGGGDVLGRDPPHGVSWSRELLFGSDAWRQEFQLVFDAGDSGFVEDSANPFVGMRLNFDFGGWERGGQGYALLRYSRDYFAGEFDFNLRHPLGGIGDWSIGNRLEGRRYRPAALDVRYIQNSTNLVAELEPARGVHLRLGDEIRLLRYGAESEAYPSYTENNAELFGNLYVGGWRAGAAAHLRGRSHGSFQENDYRELRWDISLYRYLGPAAAIMLEFQRRRRDYYNSAPQDLFYLQTYAESYLSGEWRGNLSSFLGFRFRGDGSSREYETQSPGALDFVEGEGSGEITMRFTPHVELGLGFVYGLRDYHEPLYTSADPTLAASLQQSVSFEDYTTYGPRVTLDILKSDRLMINLTDTYQWRRYPNSAVRSVANFSLFSDRHINSLLLFVSWGISPVWQLSVVGNFDDDRGEEREKGSTQSTLLSVELTYGF